MNDLKKLLSNVVQDGLTAKEAHALIKTRSCAPHPTLKIVRDMLNALATDKKISRIGKNVKIYCANGKRRYNKWQQRYQSTIIHTLQDADKWSNFHELRALLATRPGGYGGDTSLLSVALAHLVSRKGIEFVDVRLPGMDLTRYYRCQRPILTSPLCPTLTKTATDMISRWYRMGRPRFSLIELKNALKIASDTLQQLITHLEEIKLCCRIDGTSIPMFDALPVVTPQPVMAPRTKRHPPTQPRRALRAPSTPRLPYAQHPSRRPLTPPAALPSRLDSVVTVPAAQAAPHGPRRRMQDAGQPHHHPRCTASVTAEQRWTLAHHARHPQPSRHMLYPSSPECQAVLGTQYHPRPRPVMHLQRAGPRQLSTSAQTPILGHARRSEPWIGRASPPHTSACRSAMSRAGPPSGLHPPHLRPVVI